MHELLKLSHHRHTARHLPHEHTSYRALFIVVSLLACFALGMQRVHALDYAVHASVAAEMPPTPPVIDNPGNNTVVATNSDQIVVSGNCPIAHPDVIVVLKRSDQLVGSGTCNAGSFSIPVTLVLGVNIFIPTYVTIVGDYGPAGAPINVSYQPPTPITQGGGSTVSPPTPEVKGADQLTLKIGVPFIAFRANQPVSFSVAVSGGTPPYALVIIWGDGTQDAHAIQSAEQRTINHTYANALQHSVEIKLVDKAGTIRRYSLAAESTSLSLAYSTPQIKNETFLSQQTIINIWVVYGSTLVLVIMLWFIDHYELKLITKKHRKAH
jgi:hypothetical protein